MMLTLCYAQLLGELGWNALSATALHFSQCYIGRGVHCKDDKIDAEPMNARDIDIIHEHMEGFSTYICLQGVPRPCRFAASCSVACANRPRVLCRLFFSKARARAASGSCSGSITQHLQHFAMARRTRHTLGLLFARNIRLSRKHSRHCQAQHQSCASPRWCVCSLVITAITSWQWVRQ